MPHPYRTPAALGDRPPERIATEDGAEMVWVSEGWFRQGRPDGPPEQQPERRVWLSGFYIDVHQVTASQFRRFLEAASTPDYWPPCDNYKKPGREHHPVHVRWQDAMDYSRFFGKRLASEAEWEKAARGVDGRTYPWGEQRPSRDRVQIARRDDSTAPVGRYPAGASPYGALDMIGNGREWVLDAWRPQPVQASNGRDPRCSDASSSERVLRSSRPGERDSELLRATWRGCEETSSSAYGKPATFRCVSPRVAMRPRVAPPEIIGFVDMDWWTEERAKYERLCQEIEFPR